MGRAFKRFLGIILLALLMWGVRYALNADSQSHAMSGQGGEQGSWTSRFSLSSLPMPSFLTGNKLVADMQLMPRDKVVYDACMSNYRRQKVSRFTATITDEEGCACTAKHATAKVSPKDLSLLMRIHAVSLNNELIRAGELTAPQIKTVDAQWKIITHNMKKNSGMPEGAYNNIFKTAENIHASCASDNSYSPASIAQIAALQPIGYVKASMVAIPRLKPMRKS